MLPSAPPGKGCCSYSGNCCNMGCTTLGSLPALDQWPCLHEPQLDRLCYILTSFFSSSPLPFLKDYEITRLLLQSKGHLTQCIHSCLPVLYIVYKGQEEDPQGSNYDHKFICEALAGNGPVFLFPWSLKQVILDPPQVNLRVLPYIEHRYSCL